MKTVKITEYRYHIDFSTQSNQKVQLTFLLPSLYSEFNNFQSLKKMNGFGGRFARRGHVKQTRLHDNLF